MRIDDGVKLLSVARATHDNSEITEHIEDGGSDDPSDAETADEQTEDTAEDLTEEQGTEE